MWFALRILSLGSFCWLLTTTAPVKAGEKSEAALIAKLFRSIQSNHPKTFASVFPPSDSLLHWLKTLSFTVPAPAFNPETLPEEEVPAWLSDTFIQKTAAENLQQFINNSRELRIRISEAVFIRYELTQFSHPGNLFFGALRDFQYVGYLFFKNPSNRRIYGCSVSDVYFINGNWYGGLMGKIFEAANKEAYEQALMAYMKKQRLIAAGKIPKAAQKEKEPEEEEEDENETPSTIREVADRKFYKGRFDDEISVQLYVRYIKGGCPEGICSWEALFKFGDEDDFIKMDVSRTRDGRWIFSENLGAMELILKDGVYSGDYESSNDNTGYKVKLREVPLSEKRAGKLDYMLQNGLYGE